MIKHIQSFVIFFNILFSLSALASPIMQTERSNAYGKWVIGLEYKLDDTTKNPYGDLKVNLGYQINAEKIPSYTEEIPGQGIRLKYIPKEAQDSYPKSNQSLFIGLTYENNPGFLGDAGHVHGEVRFCHSNKTAQSSTKTINTDLNALLKYNPPIDTIKKPWGDVLINFDYHIYPKKTLNHIPHTNIHLDGIKRLSASLIYRNEPGLLADYGHIQGNIDIAHRNKAIHMLTQAIIMDLNILLDYNPATIERNRKLIAQLKAQNQGYDKEEQDKKEVLLAKKTSFEKSDFETDKQIFLSHKAAFESRPFDENNPKAVELKKMLEELEQVYGS